jgi:DNA-binding transcriptional ArsR family regulator
MSGEGWEDGFSRDRAELFEALGHQTRIRILQTLAETPMGFSELKKGLEIESSGLLQFHLGKLKGLVKETPEGNYALTCEGNEALSIVSAHPGPSTVHAAEKNAVNKTDILVVALLISIVAASTLGGYVFSLNSQFSSLIDNAYREYKGQYVMHIWYNLNYTEWHLIRRDTASALLTMDSALSRYQNGGWVRNAMLQYSADYRALENDPSFTNDVNQVYYYLLSIRARIYNNASTGSDLAFIVSAQQAYLLWSESLDEPVGGAYCISNPDAIKSAFHSLALGTT